MVIEVRISINDDPKACGHACEDVNEWQACAAFLPTTPALLSGPMYGRYASYLPAEAMRRTFPTVNPVPK